MKGAIIAMATLLLGQAYSQTTNSYVEGGQFSLGLRSTTSVFGHDNVPGLGVGGQFRLQLTDYLNTEWFADYISLDLNGAGVRNNTHIGWSVMFYPKKFNRVIPYIIAGHCFDYAKVTPLSTATVDNSANVISRWSSAVQAGLGTHYYLTDRFNISFSAQYMMHLGEHLDYELIETTSGWTLDTSPTNQENDWRLESHVLLTFSINYRIADFW